MPGFCGDEGMPFLSPRSAELAGLSKDEIPEGALQMQWARRSARRLPRWPPHAVCRVAGLGRTEISGPSPKPPRIPAVSTSLPVAMACTVAAGKDTDLGTGISHLAERQIQTEDAHLRRL